MLRDFIGDAIVAAAVIEDRGRPVGNESFDRAANQLAFQLAVPLIYVGRALPIPKLAPRHGRMHPPESQQTVAFVGLLAQSRDNAGEEHGAIEPFPITSRRSCGRAGSRSGGGFEEIGVGIGHV